MFHLAVAPGVELRLFGLEDAPEIFGLVERNRARVGRWLPWVEHTHTVADVERFLREQAIPQYEDNRGVHAGIRVTGELAGSVGCHPIDWANRSTSIGYWIDSAYEGRGLITRSCELFLDYLFGDMQLHRVEIRCGTGNHRSCAVPERLGFVREGVAREAEWVHGGFHDLYVWSMLEQDWRARRRTAR